MYTLHILGTKCAKKSLIKITFCLFGHSQPLFRFLSVFSNDETKFIQIVSSAAIRTHDLFNSLSTV